MDENIDHLECIFLASASGDLHAKYGFFALIVHEGVKLEAAATARIPYGPAGEASGDFSDVLLRVAAIHTERVQLHQLARVILVEAAPSFPTAIDLRIDRLPVVEVEQHGGMLGGGEHHVFKFAQHARADRVPLVGSYEVAIGTLVEVDVEMVVPEIGEDLGELPVAVDGA